jgi:hypothetical protein
MSRVIWSSEAVVCCGAERRASEESSRRKTDEESAGEGSMDWRCVVANCESCALRALILAVAALIVAGVVVVGLLGVVMGWHDGCQQFEGVSAIVIEGVKKVRRRSFDLQVTAMGTNLTSEEKCEVSTRNHYRPWNWMQLKSFEFVSLR